MARHRRLTGFADALQPPAGRPPFQLTRELIRRVQADCCVEIDGNAYSVPWRLVGEGVVVEISGGRLRILRGSRARVKVAGHLGPIERHHEEEAQRSHRAVDGRRAHAGLGCSWKRRRSSGVALSGERPRKASSKPDGALHVLELRIDSKAHVIQDPSRRWRLPGRAGPGLLRPSQRDDCTSVKPGAAAQR